MKLEFSRQIFEKYSNTKFYENPSSGRQVTACRWTDGQMDGQTDRYDENISRPSPFCEGTKNMYIN